MLHKLQQVMSHDNHLQQLKEQIIRGWPEKKDHLEQNLRPYWAFQDDIAVTDEVILKGRHVVLPERLQNTNTWTTPY